LQSVLGMNKTEKKKELKTDSDKFYKCSPYNKFDRKFDELILKKKEKNVPLSSSKRGDVQVANGNSPRGVSGGFHE